MNSYLIAGIPQLTQHLQRRISHILYLKMKKNYHCTEYFARRKKSQYLYHQQNIFHNIYI